MLLFRRKKNLFFKHILNKFLKPLFFLHILHEIQFLGIGVTIHNSTELTLLETIDSH